MTDYRDYDLNEDMENKRDINEEATPASSTLTEQEVPGSAQTGLCRNRTERTGCFLSFFCAVYGHPAPGKETAQETPWHAVRGSHQLGFGLCPVVLGCWDRSRFLDRLRHDTAKQQQQFLL